MPRSLAMLLLTGLAAWADNPNPSPYIFINNAGFENPPIPLGTQVAGIPNWELLQGAGQCPPSPSWAPLDGVLNSTEKANYDGSQVGFARGCGAGLQTTISQTLSTKLVPNATYAISVDVVFNSGTTFTLAFGSTSIGLVSQSTNCGVSQKCTLSFNYSSAAGGDPITIEMSVSGPPVAETGVYVGFDNIRLMVQYNTPVVTTYGVHGMFGPLPGQIIHSNAVCASLSTSDCTLSLDLLDSYGELVSQQQTTLRPGMSTSLDYAIPGEGGPQTNQRELIPLWFLGSGQASFALEIFDSESGRTGLFTNWADGSVSKLGNLDSGPVSLTRSENARVKVFCDGSVRNTDEVSAACIADVAFADAATGRILKESRMTLQPSTGGYVDLLFEEANPLTPRTSITPMVTITGGPGVASVALLDSALGGTLVQTLLSPPLTAAQ